MFLYTMLDRMLAYLMFAVLFNAACLYNANLFLAFDFCKYFLFSCFVFFFITQFVNSKCYIASCTMPLIGWFILRSHRFL